MKLQLFLLSFLIISFLYLSLSLFLFNPPPWPDEAYITDIAISFLNKGVIATDIWGELVPGSEQHFFWYPPLLFILLAGWIKIFGLYIFQERLLSLVTATIFLLVYYLLNKSFIFRGKNLFIISFAPLILLIIDPTFLVASRIIRPEIFVLLFSTLSLYLSFRIEQASLTKSVKYTLALLSGISLSFAVLTHFMGLIFVVPIYLQILYTEKFNIVKSKIIQLFSLGLSLPLLIWFISILPTLRSFIEQISLQNQYRFFLKPHIWTVFCCKPWEIKINYSIYLLLAIIFIFYSLKQKVSKYLILSLIQILCIIYIWVGKLEWYTTLVIPFIFLGLIIMVKNMINNRVFLFFLLSLVVIFTINNLKIYFEGYIFYKNTNYQYNKFAQQILEVIPDNMPVYLSSIPDAYFGFKPDRKNQLFQFSLLPSTRNGLESILNRSDYIVYSELLLDPKLVHFFINYVDLNRIEIFEIGSENQYQAIIIKLKPLQERQVPK